MKLPVTGFLTMAILGLAPALAGHLAVRIAPAQEVRLEFDLDARVLFFPQVHNARGAWNRPAVQRQIVTCQYVLARFLWEHPDYAVFDEGRRNRTRATLPLEDRAQVLAAFPEGGLPASMAELKPGQREVLLELGAGKVVLALGRLPEIHEAIPYALESVLDQAIRTHLAKVGGVFGKLDAAAGDIVMGQREQATADHVKGFLAGHPHRKALIIYGSAHDFRPYFKDLPYAEVSGLAGVFWSARKEEKKAQAETPPAPPAAGHRTPLMEAIIARDPRRVGELLAQGADPRAKDDHGYTPLLLAGLVQDPAILDLLLAHLAPADLAAPVALIREDTLKTYEDPIHFFEEASAHTLAVDYFELIQRLKAFASSAPAAPGKAQAPGGPDPGEGFLSRFLPPAY
jgi:hypothetical protein